MKAQQLSLKPHAFMSLWNVSYIVQTSLQQRARNTTLVIVLISRDIISKGITTCPVPTLCHLNLIPHRKEVRDV